MNGTARRLPHSSGKTTRFPCSYAFKYSLQARQGRAFLCQAAVWLQRDSSQVRHGHLCGAAKGCHQLSMKLLLYRDFGPQPVDWDGRGKADSLRFLIRIDDAP